MSLPQIELDDRDFQSLVDEARLRIAHTCPEWNEHNVSDPGITLIELFAWMTDMLIYRVNRIPEKVQIALLDLVGVALEPAQVARTDLRFRLSAPASARVRFEAGAAEVTPAHQPPSGPVVFRNVEPIVVPALRLESLKLVRGGRASDAIVRDGTARLSASEQPGLSSELLPHDGLYLGFHDSLSTLVVAVTVETSRARGTGVDPHRPPWIWEAASSDGGWSRATVLSDDTGGLNYATGAVELQLPRTEGPATVAGRRLHWLRCRLPERGRSAPEGYTHAPRLQQLRIAAIGVRVAAEHAARVAAPSTLAEAERIDAKDGEILGYSDGSPGQVFSLRRRPALELGEGDGLDVIDHKTGEWSEWVPRDSFADSGPEDRHYRFDPVAGEVSFGPAIRERDGWVRRGKIPPEGAAVRMRYRWGGGASGNVGAGALTILRRPLPGVASVTNPRPAHGGLDPESLAEAIHNAPQALRTRWRAVTAADYAALAREASRLVARARCVESQEDRALLSVHILPTVPHPSTQIDPVELLPSRELLEGVARYLDERRLLGMRLCVAPMELRGVTVVVEARPTPGTDSKELSDRVAKALYRYINPYVGGDLSGESDGWQFGRGLTRAEVETLVGHVPGVGEISLLRLYATDLTTGEPQAHPLGDRLTIGADELVASATHVVRVSERDVR